MQEHPVEDRPFLKLLFPHDNTKLLHSRNFPFYTAAAKCISAINSPSAKHLEIDKNSDTAHFTNRIREFILNKRQLGPFAATASYIRGKPKSLTRIKIKR